MRRLGAMVVGMGMMVGSAAPVAFADGRSIQELPGDLARWSTLWVEVPKRMVEVGQRHGPLAALTWGPMRGTFVVVESTTKELWERARADRQPGARRERQGPKGVIFRYEF